jgi:Aspartyl protease
LRGYAYAGCGIGGEMNGFSLVIEPDDEDIEAAEVLVDGKIGGKEYRFLLDTGAARTAVALDDYTALFAATEKHTSSAVFAKSSDDLITVPSLELGPIRKENFTVARAPEPGTGRNLIGMDLLKDFSCRFLFSENRVLVDAPPGLRHSELRDLFLDTVFHPYVDVWFGDSKASAVWDTGAGITVVDRGFIERHPAYFLEGGKSTGTDATGFSMQTPMFTMEAVVIGGREFPPHRVAGVDLSQVNSGIEVPMDLILGYSTLSNADWFFGFPSRNWAVLNVAPKRR